MGGERPLAVTMGEPAGIGPELCLRALDSEMQKPMVVFGDYDFLAARAGELGIAFSAKRLGGVDDVDDVDGVDSVDGVECARAVWHCPLAALVTAGKPSPENAESVLTQLRIAAKGCLAGDFCALTTAPVQKSAICESGADFTGQTEFLARESGTARAVMLLAGRRLRVALATTHLPLARVADAVDAESLRQTLAVLDAGLKRWFGIANPRIHLTGLNPHCGEGGFFGGEEARAIVPAIARAREDGVCAAGPFPADTVFIGAARGDCDCVLAMYHDQGLPAVKLDGMGAAVNVTLGLPFLRTSPAHGTALDVAAKGGARTEGMFAALEFAAEIK